jgi:hypothetical protein
LRPFNSQNTHQQFERAAPGQELRQGGNNVLLFLLGTNLTLAILIVLRKGI